MRTRTTVLAVLLVTFLTPACVFGQCVPTDTPLECWQRFAPAITKQAEGQIKTDVTTANTGWTGVVSGASPLQDFLSILSTSLDSSSLTSNGTALTFAWNPRVAKDQPLKIEVDFVQPQLSSATTTALASNAAGLSSLKDSLTSSDDITASLTYSPATMTFGRSIEPHRPYFDALAAVELAGPIADAQAKSDDELIQALQAVQANPSSMNQQIATLVPDSAQQKVFINKIEAAAKAQKQLFVFDDKLTRSFAKLLNNQPQLYVSFQYHDRKDVVGPKETIVKAAYEYGFLNLNTFFRRYRTLCDPLIVAQGDDAGKQKCADLLQAYAGYGGPDDSRDAGRIALSLEYHAADAVQVDAAQYSLKYAIDSGRSIVGSLTGGWNIAPRPSQKSGRIDLAVSYENIRNAAVLTGVTPPPADAKDRLVARITYTQKLSDTISFPVSFIYANHAAYLSNIDRKLNAHFGISYKLPQSW